MFLVAVLAAFAFGYAMGSVPFGVVLTRLAGAGDLRSVGSGNIGATNVLRTGRKGLAAGTLILDALKGTVAVLLVMFFWNATAPSAMVENAEAAAGFLRMAAFSTGAAALGAMIGHCFPVWLGFHGGKGVATYLGVTLAIHPFAAFFFAVVWLATAYATRYSSLSALVAVGTAPIVAAIMGEYLVAGVLAAMSVVVYYRHSDNIRRLATGTERRIGDAA